ncbi:hypothetical protein BCY86_02135 [Pajaroellobacter abortibovis]|uniref:Outer membrane lipoprotein BamD-like domain-containing protein n=2 Tax=Pajaroellobacter abortibovis TaxID=1882918 RepID=A0A1L6MVP1_9BACT|nr:hypothetical protein BCY86_02135 [Pajaroellobacter abortibovis]
MLEMDDELREIKRELTESRTLIIRTNNLTNALSADIRSMLQKEQLREQRLVWTSATAYVVFVLVVLVALKFAWDARVEAIKLEAQQKIGDIERLRKEWREEHKWHEEHTRAEGQVYAFYELLQQGRLQDFVEHYQEIKNERMTKTEAAFLAEATEKAQHQLAYEAYLRGLERTHAQRWQESASAYEESLRYADYLPTALNAKIGLAEAYRHLQRYPEAIAILHKLMETKLPKDVRDDILYQLALCETALQAWPEAKNTWQTLLRRFPDSRYAVEARVQIARLPPTPSTP